VFFKRSRKGRPKKSGTLAADKVKVNVVKRGRPPSKEQNSAPKPTKASPKAAAPTSQTAQKKDPPEKRTNWTLPENQAVLKLADKGGDVAKLTVKEMSSILFACYSIDMPPNKSGAKKPDYVKALEGAIQSKGHGLLSSAVALLEVTGTDESEAEDGGDDEPAPARTHFNEDD
jgi:hypothetical protein